MNSYALCCQEPIKWVPSQNQAIIMCRHLNTLTWQNVAVILAWGMWAHGHWTVWNELIGDSTIKKAVPIHQQHELSYCHSTHQTVITCLTVSLQTTHISFRPLPRLSCFENEKQTSRFPNEIHTCRTLTNCTPSRGNPMMTGRILTKGINPVISNI